MKDKNLNDEIVALKSDNIVIGQTIPMPNGRLGFVVKRMEMVKCQGLQRRKKNIW